MSTHPSRILCGVARPTLAKEIALNLCVGLIKSTIQFLPDSEIQMTLEERNQHLSNVCPSSTRRSLGSSF